MRPICPGLGTQALSAIPGAELNSITLEYTAILSKTADLPLITGSGVMTSQHILERLMLGAQAVGICSTVYLNSLQAVSDCVAGLGNYLSEYGYSNCNEIRGCALESFVEGNGVVMHALKASIGDVQKCRKCDRICLEKTAPESLALSKDGHRIVMSERACTGCSLCYCFCPEGAIEMIQEQ